MIPFIKRNLAGMAAVLIGFATCFAAYLCTYQTGYFRDLNPGVEMETLLTIEWATLFLSFALTLAAFILWLTKKGKAFLIAILVVIVAVSGAFAGSQLTFREANKEGFAKVAKETSQTIKPNFHERDLDELKDMLSDESEHEEMIYIGRNDCEECTAFEEQILGALEKNHLGLFTYYTNSDRDGSRSEEMYSLFEKYGIGSVPYVLVTKNQTIINAWEDPVAHLAEIEAALGALKI